MTFESLAHWREHPSNLVILGLIGLCALAAIAMPLSKSVRTRWMYAMHGREDSQPVMAAVQVVPKMYNFANRYIHSYVPLTEQELSNPPSTLPAGADYGWLNHYPSWIMTANPLTLFQPGDQDFSYMYLLSRWRGHQIITTYVVKLDRRSKTQGAISIRRLTP